MTQVAGPRWRGKRRGRQERQKATVDRPVSVVGGGSERGEGKRGVSRTRERGKEVGSGGGEGCPATPLLLRKEVREVSDGREESLDSEPRHLGKAQRDVRRGDRRVIGNHRKFFRLHGGVATGCIGPGPALPEKGFRGVGTGAEERGG